MPIKNSKPRNLVETVGGSFVSFIVSKITGYLLFAINVPYVFALTGLSAMLIVIITNVYHIDLFWILNALPIIGDHIPHDDITLHANDIILLYTEISFFFFVLSELIRTAFRIPPMSLRRKFVIHLAFATIIFALLLVHLPFIAVAVESSRSGLAGIFFLFYVVILISLIFGSFIELGAKKLRSLLG